MFHLIDTVDVGAAVLERDSKVWVCKQSNFLVHDAAPNLLQAVSSTDEAALIAREVTSLLETMEVMSFVAVRNCNDCASTVGRYMKGPIPGYLASNSQTNYDCTPNVLDNKRTFTPSECFLRSCMQTGTLFNGSMKRNMLNLSPFIVAGDAVDAVGIKNDAKQPDLHSSLDSDSVSPVLHLISAANKSISMLGSSYQQQHHQQQGHAAASGWFKIGLAAVTRLCASVLLGVMLFFRTAGAAMLELWPFLFLLSAAQKVRVSQQYSKLIQLALLGMSLQFAAAAPISVDLTTFTPGAGARFIGTAFSSTGCDVSIIGDHNGDGFADYVMSSSFLGKAIIVLKKNTTNVEMMFDNVVSGPFFRVIKGINGDSIGTAVGGIGDINGDGFDDVIVGAGGGKVTGRAGIPGFAVVLFGMKGPFTDLTVSAAWNDPSLGFVVLGPADAVAFVNLARSVRGLGDVNGDGVDDFAVTASKYAGTTAKTKAGVVYVIHGKKAPQTFSTIDTLLVPNNFGNNGTYYTGAVADDQLGYAVMPAGDFNGDGIADFLMGAWQYSPVIGSGTRTKAGAAYLIHGSKTALATMDMSTFVTGSKGVRFLGAAVNNGLGYAVAGVGDINDDGLDDIALGAYLFQYLARTQTGVVYVIFGTKVVFSADVNLQSFAASSIGFAIYGSISNLRLCIAAPAGDMDGDGINDILVGGFNNRLSIVYGQKGVRAQHVDTLTDGVTTFSLTGGYNLGAALDGGKDLNGDGIPDLLIGDQFATVTPEGGGSPISFAGAIWMVPGPFAPPANVDPTVVPSLAPTLTPTRTPSTPPSLNPSQTPSMTPSIDPSVQPSAAPSVSPSKVPSMTPSAAPSTQPSVNPSQKPSTTPSAAPSTQPSVAPSVSPSMAPSLAPSTAPSALPSAAPSVSPSQMPSMTPSATPTAQPSEVPSVSPSQLPTLSPNIMPTVSPSSTPTVRPTLPAVKNFELVVDVEQDVNGIDKDDYDGNKVAYNQTIQHTVANATDGVVPERVTEIVIEDEEEEGRRLSTASGSVRLKYRITVFDPMLTVEKLRAQLVQAAQEGKMDASLRYYAAQFGATGLVNGTFGEPQVTSAAVQRDASEQLTGVQIALVVIGVIVCVAFVAVCVWLALSQKQTQPSPSPAGDRV